MSRLALKGIQAAAGAAGDPVYVDDVFSTDLWTTASNNDNATITNGLDLSGEGGLIWLKNRNTSGNNTFFDSARGLQYGIYADGTDAQWDTTSFGFTAPTFSANGYTTGTASVYTTAGTHVGWSFRKQPGFFDVVTYTGNGTAGRTVNHNLGSVPGFMVVKKLNSTSDWTTYHRSMGATKYAPLNDTDAYNTGTAIWNSTEPTATQFTVGDNTRMNNNGDTYVAYLFAHDAQDFGENSDEAIIKCGSYTGNGSGVGPSINLGFEPQWLMIKSTGNNSGVWTMIDTMRGTQVGGNDAWLEANTSDAEDNFEFLSVTPTGFNINTSGYYVNASSVEYIYMAIRRPHKPASEFVATDLFALAGNTYSTSDPSFVSGFPVDMALSDGQYMGWDKDIATRLTGTKRQETNKNSAEGNQPAYKWDYMNGYMSGSNGSTYGWQWRRAPGFFDVVAYAGDGTSSRAITHNLGVVPEMIWLKNRDRSGGGANWIVATPTDAPKEGALNTDGGFTAYGNITAFSASTFTLLNGAEEINHGSYDYIAYLFATVAGISKVGSYTGTGNDLNVDCGFSAGARFVLVKRTDSTGDWYLWDSVRGIVAGNDPYLLLNSSAAQVTNTDYIDPLSSGFTVTSSAPAALNASSGTYIFYAIA